jgi:hypothetical protein
MIWDMISRIAQMIGLQAENAESLQVIRYAQGQKYNKHTDAYNPTNERGRAACRDGGNRIVTALIYLSEVEAGGETGFINLRFVSTTRTPRSTLGTALPAADLGFWRWPRACVSRMCSPRGGGCCSSTTAMRARAPCTRTRCTRASQSSPARSAQ